MQLVQTAALLIVALLLARVPTARPQRSGVSGSISSGGAQPQQGSGTQFSLTGQQQVLPSQMDVAPGPSGSISFAGDFTNSMANGGGSGGVWPQRKCVDITVPLCRGIGYNHTCVLLFLFFLFSPLLFPLLFPFCFLRLSKNFFT